MRKNPDTLNLAMDYAQVMESCAAYVACNAPCIREPVQLVNFARAVIEAAGSNLQESFFVVLLNIKNRAIGIPREITRGGLDNAGVHPREVFRPAIVEGAASVILCHNHPSGDPTPSREDVEVTKRLVEAGRLLGVSVVDHVILGRPGYPGSPAGYISMRDRNLVGI